MGAAAVIIVGDEILSGKVRDTNAPLLVDLLHEVGMPLARVVVIGDEPEQIAEEVRRCSERYSVVITAGGIGPTHDDRTVEGVAAAFRLGMVRSAELEAMIRQHWGPRVNDAALRMADVPEGSRLLYGPDELLPLVVVHNVYLLPGVPQLLAAKLVTLRRELSGHRLELRSLYLTSDESMVASLLAQAAAEMPQVKIGSYPCYVAADYRLWITVEATTGEAVRRAVLRLLDLLPPDDVVRLEPEL